MVTYPDMGQDGEFVNVFKLVIDLGGDGAPFLEVVAVCRVEVREPVGASAAAACVLECGWPPNAVPTLEDRSAEVRQDQPASELDIGRRRGGAPQRSC